MIKKVIRAFAEWMINNVCYEKLTVKNIDPKLIKPVDGLVIDGKQYYEFVDIKDMPPSRHVHYLCVLQEFQIGMDRPTVNEFLDAMMAANNRGDTSKIGLLCFMFKDFICNCTPTQTIYNFASLIYFDEKEDLKTWDAEHNKVKIDGFRKLKNHYDFLNGLLDRGPFKHIEESKLDVEKYLKVSDLKYQQYVRLMRETK